MIEGAGFSPIRQYTCQFFDRPNLEVSKTTLCRRVRSSLATANLESLTLASKSHMCGTFVP
jgi:hypothetical protein